MILTITSEVGNYGETMMWNLTVQCMLLCLVGMALIPTTSAAEELSDLMRKALGGFREKGEPDLAAEWESAEASCIAKDECKAAYSTFSGDMEFVAVGLISGQEVTSHIA